MNWIGGKSQSCKKIVELIPEHDCYIEVFAGGLWTFFCKAPSKIEIINNLNSELINFYRVIQRQPDKFMEREKYELYSSDLYYEYLQDFYSGKHATLTEVERAFRFFCMIKEAFGSKFGGGWGYSGTKNVPSPFFNEFKMVNSVSERLKSAVIDNRDFEDVINSYDNPRVMFYCDPPYMKSDNTNYYYKSEKGEFTLSDHQRLFNKLKTIKGKVILTIDDMPWIRERYTKENGFYIIENEVCYSSGGTTNGTNNTRHEIELIILNYNPERIQKHIDVRQGKLEF